MTSEDFGRDVLGPIVGEFCLRLWLLGTFLKHPDDTAMLFCARGGLRMMLAYERFLASSGLPIPIKIVPFMVSRVVAIRPVLLQMIEHGRIPAAAASALSYEFSNHSLRDVTYAISGCDVGETGVGTEKFTPEAFASVMMSANGSKALTVIAEQSVLLRRHLELCMNGRRHAILVDTGLFGTVMQLLSSAAPNLDISCAMIARANYRGELHATPHYSKTFGLSVEANGYTFLQKRSSILRHWKLIESTFEPELPSVRTFSEKDGIPVSNMEIPGWRDSIEPANGSIFAGVMAYIESIKRENPSQVSLDAYKSWNKLYRAVVWPTVNHGVILDVGVRSNDFGSDAVSTSRPWKSPLDALRGHTLWREGEIARAETPLRLPLLAAIEAGYGVRLLKRKLFSGGGFI